MSKQHTPGKLTLLPNSKTTIYTADEYETFVASCRAGQINRTKRDQANARRLVACWNACENLPTEMLEAVRKVPLAAATLLGQRDELLEALKNAEAALSDIGDAEREPGDDVAWCEARAAQSLPFIRAAIAKIEGGGV